MPPRIIYEGDEAAAHQLLPAAQNLLHKARTMAAASGAGVTGLSLAPTADSFVYALKVGDTEVLHIFHAPSSEYTLPEFSFEGIPDILSGVTRTPRLRTYTTTDAQGNTVVKSTLEHFKPNVETAKATKRPMTFASWDRLAVRPHSSVQFGQDFPWVSQYLLLHPSSYSGRMQKLVQMLLGYGRIQPQLAYGSREQQATVSSNGVQVQYDSRWHRCHILTTGADGTQWVVEISIGRGVLAMRLPKYPSKRVRIDENSPTWLSTVVEEFGGLPTGEPFPTGKVLNGAIETGEILRLATAEDLAEFYRMSPYSSALGWTTNSKGDEAHNTGWYWGEDNIRRSAHYRLVINIGPLKKKREENEPIADGSATLQLVSSGKFYHPSRKSPPPIKFHEPLIGGLLSVEMLAGLEWGGQNPDTSVAAIPKCDCTMHVCFIDDRLRLVNYFWDRTHSQDPPVVEDTTEPCMYQGAWYRQTTRPGIDFLPTFYTTDFDNRERGTESVTREDIVGTDMGHWSYHWGVDTFRPYAPQWGTLWRTRPFRIKSVNVSYGGSWTTAAIVVPQGVRDGYAYAAIRMVPGSTSTKSTGYRELTDPHSYGIYQWFYSSYKPSAGCWLQFHYKVREVYGPEHDGCNEMIDEGDWRNVCGDGEPTMGPSLPKPTLTLERKPYKYIVKPILSFNGGDKAVALREGQSEDTDNGSTYPLWRARSPDPDYPDLVQQFTAPYSVLGTFHMAHLDTINGDQKRIGPLLANEQDGEYNFIGVL